jgi:hypothetical protein
LGAKKRDACRFVRGMVCARRDRAREGGLLLGRLVVVVVVVVVGAGAIGKILFDGGERRGIDFARIERAELDLDDAPAVRYSANVDGR